MSYAQSMHCRPQQIAETVLMVRPANFAYNPETASSNSFQTPVNDSGVNVSQKAIQEFDGFVAQLRSVGISVVVVEDSIEPKKTDAVFPNNWVSFHEDGRIVLYPMLSENRRLERGNPTLESLANYAIAEKVNLSIHEAESRFLEGTGSMIIDRENGIVYACQSPRTSPELVSEFAELFGYYPVTFEAVDRQGIPIYHTNVLMALGEEFVVICLETIHDQTQIRLLLNCFAETGKEIIEIEMNQMEAFAGNMLQVRNATGDRFVILSATALSSLSATQKTALERHGKLLSVEIPTIEQCGGGSARCMMAEIFLPVKSIN